MERKGAHEQEHHRRPEKSFDQNHARYENTLCGKHAGDRLDGNVQISCLGTEQEHPADDFDDPGNGE
jgi:hypothetical protein